MPYILTILGLLIMCVPEDASPLRVAVQGGAGLIIFMSGIGLLIEKNG